MVQVIENIIGWGMIVIVPLLGIAAIFYSAHRSMQRQEREIGRTGYGDRVHRMIQISNKPGTISIQARGDINLTIKE